jgi:hypothetical protein
MVKLFTKLSGQLFTAKSYKVPELPISRHKNQTNFWGGEVIFELTWSMPDNFSGHLSIIIAAFL